MQDFIFRRAVSTDIPELSYLWQQCFHDSDEYISSFFETMYPTGGAYVALHRSRIVSCAYYLKSHQIHIPGSEPVPCSYIYAVGTLPDFRCYGLGRNVTQGAVSLAADCGFPISVICPAEESLFGYYYSVGFKNAFSVSECKYSAAELSHSNSFSYQYETPDSYRYIRRKKLSGIPHLEILPETLKYISESYQFINFDISGNIGCAAYEVYNDTAYIKELLCEDPFSAVSCLDSIIHAEKYIVRTPGNGRYFAMIYPNTIFSGSGYFGFALD